MARTPMIINNFLNIIASGSLHDPADQNTSRHLNSLRDFLENCAKKDDEAKSIEALAKAIDKHGTVNIDTLEKVCFVHIPRDIN